jgi:hypothetical protein
MQPRARRAGFEFTSIAYKKQIERCPVQARLIVIGIDKGAGAALWHPFFLQTGQRNAADPS